MAENTQKTLNARIIHKNDTLENWNKATGFKPKTGEMILINDAPCPIRLGNDEDTVAELPPLFSAIPNYKIQALFYAPDINFSIDAGPLYQAYSSMTWQDYVASEYNNCGGVILGDYVSAMDISVVLAYEPDGSYYVQPGDLIQNYQYYTVPAPSM